MGIRETANDRALRQARETDDRKRIDRTKGVEQARTSKAFNDVINEKMKGEQQRRTNLKTRERNQQQDPDKQLDPRRKVRLPGEPVQPDVLKRRAQLSRMAVRSQQGTSKRSLEAGAFAGTQRAAELEKSAETERDTVDRDFQREDLRDAREVEDRYAAATDPDAQGQSGNGQNEQGKQQQQQQQQGREEQQQQQQQNQEVVVVVTPGQAQQARSAGRIPPEIVASIAKTIAIAAAKEGAGEVVVSLKGELFDGVDLRVSAKRGKVRCTFENCDRMTGNLLEASKGDLMRGLAVKGLELDILRVKLRT